MQPAADVGGPQCREWKPDEHSSGGISIVTDQFLWFRPVTNSMRVSSSLNNWGVIRSETDNIKQACHRSLLMEGAQ